MSGVDFILHRLIHRERLHRLKTFTMIAVGLPLSLPAPLFLATVFWLALRLGRKLVPFAAGVGWLDLFVVMSVVTVPLLYRTALRSGGEYLSNVLRDTGPGRGVTPGLAFMPGVGADARMIAAVAANPRASSAALMELFLFGPGLVVSGWRQARLAAKLRSVDRQRAARILVALLPRDRGIDTQELLDTGEELGDVVPALAYLTFFQWIGAGEGWRHVWIDTEARQKLQTI